MDLLYLRIATRQLGRGSSAILSTWKQIMSLPNCCKEVMTCFSNLWHGPSALPSTWKQIMSVRNYRNQVMAWISCARATYYNFFPHLDQVRLLCPHTDFIEILFVGLDLILFIVSFNSAV